MGRICSVRELAADRGSAGADPFCKHYANRARFGLILDWPEGPTFSARRVIVGEPKEAHEQESSDPAFPIGKR